LDAQGEQRIEPVESLLLLRRSKPRSSLWNRTKKHDPNQEAVFGMEHNKASSQVIFLVEFIINIVVPRKVTYCKCFGIYTQKI